MIKKTVSILLCLVFVSSIATLSFADPAMKEGKWEITTKMEMPGMPMEMPPMTYTQCLSKTRTGMIPRNNQRENPCGPVDVKLSGDTVSWTINCDGESGPMRGNGRITYSGDTMKGTIKMNQGGMDMTSSISGRYLGPCE